MQVHMLSVGCLPRCGVRCTDDMWPVHLLMCAGVFARSRVQALPAVPTSVLLLYGGGPGADGGEDSTGLFLQVGLNNGVLMRTEVSGLT